MIEVLIFSLVTFAVFIGGPILVVVLVVRGVKQSRAAKAAAVKTQQERQQAQDAFLSTYAGWTDYAYSPFDHTFMAVDANQGQIALGRLLDAKTYKMSDVTSVAISKDGAVVGIRRDTPGALFLPQTGYFVENAVLKAIESPTTSINTVMDLTLKVTVNDPACPIYEVNFYRALTPIGVNSQDPGVIAAAKLADKFHAYIFNALHIAGPEAAAPATDAADRIQKLWDLKQAGAITEDEFAAQKAKLLST